MKGIREYAQQLTWLPECPLLKKIISVPRQTIYINLAAAPTANIILLEQGETE